MLERRKALKALKKAVSAVKQLDEPDQVESALDSVASALKPLYQDLPDNLKGWAVPLDAVLAYLASVNQVSRETARAASRLLERASIERYDGSVVEVEPDEVSEEDRSELFAGLESFYEDLEAEFKDDDEGA
jgi:HEPN domain-containing protein